MLSPIRPYKWLIAGCAMITLVCAARVEAQTNLTRSDSTALWKSMMDVELRLWNSWPEVFVAATSVFDQVRNSSCKGCMPKAHLTIGKFYWANGEYAMALHHFRASFRLARETGDWATEADALHHSGITHYYQAYYDSALYYYDHTYAIFESKADRQGMIQLLHDISLMYHRRGNFKKAIEYLFKEEAAKERFPENTHSVEALSMGNLMVDSLYYRQVIADELRDLTGNLSKGDSNSIVRAYHNLAKSHRQLKEHRVAARYFRKSSELMAALGKNTEWDMAAQDYREAGMKDSCLYFHYLAKSEMGRANQLGAVWTIELLGDAHRRFNQYDSSLFYYDSALSWNYRLNNRITYTGIHCRLVDVHTKLGNYDLAAQHLQKGLSLAKEVALIHEKNLYSEGKALYEKTGDFKNALLYSEMYNALQDSINRAEIALNLTRIQAEYNTARKEKELNELQVENQLNEAKMSARNLQFLLAISFIVIIAAVGTLYYSRYRQKKKANEVLERQKLLIEQQNSELQRQNVEKEALLHEIHHRVKNNLQIISSLISLKTRQASGETILALQQLNGRIFSMGLIHEKLYQSENLRTVRIDEYLTELAHQVLESMSEREQRVSLKAECDPVEFDVESALTCGLINNELLTNSMKYAFAPDQVDREIMLSLKKMGDSIMMKIADNGRRNIGNHEIRRSFGLRFVDQLVTSKLGGEWSVRTGGGFQVHIKLPVRQAKSTVGDPEFS